MHVNRKRAIISMTAVIAIGLGAFAAVYAVRSPEPPAVAEGNSSPPDGSVTPPPDSTPNPATPYWYVPYINQDRQRAAFKGELGGLAIDPGSPGRSAFDICPGDGMRAAQPGTELDTVAGPGPLRIDIRVLPQGVVPTNLPDAFLCRGALAQVAWAFSVPSGLEDVNEGGSSLHISRLLGLEPINRAGPIERWDAHTINGHKAVALNSVVSSGAEQFGGCFAAVYDEMDDVLTLIDAGAANSPFCLAVAEAVTR